VWSAAVQRSCRRLACVVGSAMGHADDSMSTCHATPVPVPLVHKAVSPTGAHSRGHIAPTLSASGQRHAHHQDHLPLRQRSAHAPVPRAASRSAAEGQALTQEPCSMTLRALQGGSQESSGTAGRAAPLLGAGRLLRGRTLRAALQRRPAPRSWQGGEATVTARSASERQSPREGVWGREKAMTRAERSGAGACRCAPRGTER
jgi:hypothetical protein